MKSRVAERQAAASKRKRDETEDETRATGATAGEGAKRVVKKRRMVLVEVANQPQGVMLPLEAALKRKRNEAKEEDRVKAAKANSERDARALKRQRVRSDEASTRVEALQDETKRAKSGMAPQDQAGNREQQPRPEDTEGNIHTAETVTELQPTVAQRDQAHNREEQSRAAEEDVNNLPDHVDGTVTEVQVEVTPQDQARRSRSQNFTASPESRKRLPTTAQEATAQTTANPSGTGHPEESNHAASPEPRAAVEVPTEDHADQMREVLRSMITVNRSRRIKGLENNRWVDRLDHLMSGENGPKQLDARIAMRELHGDDTDDLLNLRQETHAALEAIEQVLKYLVPALRDADGLQLEVNSQIYGFADVPRDTPSLAFLSDEFWATLDDCQAANTASKDLERRLHELEREQRVKTERFLKHGKRAASGILTSVAEVATMPKKVDAEDSAEGPESRLDAFYQHSYPKEVLLESLQQARHAQAELEAKLNGIADGLLTQSGLLDAELPGEEAAQGAQGPGESAMAHSDRSSDSSAEETGSAQEAGSAPAAYGEQYVVRSETNDEDQPAAMSNSPAGRITMTREDREEHARREAEKEGNRCHLHESKQSRSKDAIAALKIKVEHAGKMLESCQRDFDNAKRTYPPAIDFLSPEDQGPARVEFLREKTRKLVEAEDAYRNSLNKALNAGMTDHDEGQTWNFCCCNDQTFDVGDVITLTRRKREGVQKWLDATTDDDDQTQTVPPPNWQLEEKMDWDLLLEPGHGEDPDVIADGEIQQHINRERDFQQKLRQEGLPGIAKGMLNPESAENDLHPGNRDASMSSQISQPLGWANVSRPLIRCKDAASNGDAQDPSKDNTNEPQGPPNSVDPDGKDEPDQVMPEDEQHPASNGSGQSPLDRRSAPVMVPDDEQRSENIESGKSLPYDFTAMPSEDIAQRLEAGSNQEKPNDDQPRASNGKGQMLGGSPPMIDYAIDGYEGDNMDGIE